MTTDRPAGGLSDDAPTPTEVAAAEPTRDGPPLEPTQVIPQLEPTAVIPGNSPPPAFPVGSTSGPASAAWPPPEGHPIAEAPQWFPPFPTAQAYPQQSYPQPPSQQGPSWAQQPGQHPGTPGFVGQGDGYGWQPAAGPSGYWTAAPPQPLTGFPPRTPPPPRGHGWVVALVTVAAVVVISLIAALAVPVLAQLPSRRGGPTASPSAPASGSPTTKPSTSPRPGSSPTPTLPTNPLDVLKKNPVYALTVPAKCPYQSTPASQAAFRKQVNKLVDCANAAWKKALAPTAVEFSKPKVKFYGSSAKSPCGRLGTNFPASYCTGDSTLYFSLQSYIQGRYYRLSVAGLVMHEYAHHVQNLTGIFDARGAMDEPFAVTTRRIELQAHCMAHYALVVSKVGYNPLDRRELEYQWTYTSDPKGHGSAKAEAYWGRRGLDGKTIGACNTWSVKASRVK